MQKHTLCAQEIVPEFQSATAVCQQLSLFIANAAFVPVLAAHLQHYKTGSAAVRGSTLMTMLFVKACLDPLATYRSNEQVMNACSDAISSNMTSRLINAAGNTATLTVDSAI